MLVDFPSLQTKPTVKNNKFAFRDLVVTINKSLPASANVVQTCKMVLCVADDKYFLTDLAWHEEKDLMAKADYLASFQ